MDIMLLILLGIFAIIFAFFVAKFVKTAFKVVIILASIFLCAFAIHMGWFDPLGLITSMINS